MRNPGTRPYFSTITRCVRRDDTVTVTRWMHTEDGRFVQPSHTYRDNARNAPRLSVIFAGLRANAH